MNTGKQQKPVLTGQRFKTRKRDEKEKFEPTVFRDTIVQGLNEAGGGFTSLTSNLTFPLSAPGGTRIDDGDKTKVTEHCMFKTEENHTAVRSYAQNDIRVKRSPGGTRIDDGDKTKVTEHCMFKTEENHTAVRSYAQELFPANKQNVEHFSTYFTEAGLKELSDFLRTQQSLGTRKELQKELQERLSQQCPIREIVVYVKEEMKKNDLQEQAVIGLLWSCLMNAVEWNKKEELVTEQALKHLKHYAPLLAVFSTQGQSELVLLLKIQEYCYDNIHFMKSFSKIVVLFYKADVLSEEAILKWYKDAHAAKGKSVFLEQMKKFVEWLHNAEEESESEGEDD
ncbi:basic leucine zipper and W2 domain-containing protein 2-like [Sinocyclocheilus grahami]|uniref:basic leucine zipper and W2 domain-containing protein 2-like n=1 Tax=Sinocyclocheilus grahami TaxID=75366 RepID=UPI0007AC91A0|nr:PREDICTED: basic leucine zipper and W2 domain-containing protein 2-like [Sinocyclocheilus grahami]